MRLILKSEMDLNLEFVRDIYSQIKHEDGPKADEETRMANNKGRADLLLSIPVPPYRKDAFVSQLGSLASSLTTTEIEDTLRLYAGLSRLESIRAELSALKTMFLERANSIYAPGMSAKYLRTASPVVDEYDARLPALWQEYSEVEAALLSRGNPLGTPSRNTESKDQLPAKRGWQIWKRKKQG